MKVRAHLIANYAGQIWTAAANVAFVPIFIHYLGIEGYALIGIYTMLQAWFALLDLGMSPTLSREMARFIAGSIDARRATELLRSVETICAAFVALCAMMFALAAPTVAVHGFKTTLPVGDVVNALRLCGIVVACRLMETIYRSALYGLDRQIWFNAFNVAVTTARFGGAAAILALVSPTIQAFFVWQLVVSVLSVLMLRFKTHRSVPSIAAQRFSAAALRDIQSFAGGLVAINLTALVLTQADKLAISLTLPLAQLGYYTLATTVANLIAAAVGPISQAFYPLLSKQHAMADEDGLRHSYSLAAQIVSVVAMSAGTMLVFFSRNLIFFWSGNASLARDVAPIVSLLTASTMANALLQIPYFTLLARGEVRSPLYLNVVFAVLFLAGLGVCIPNFGLKGAAGTLVATNVGALIANVFLLRRSLPGTFRDWALRDVAAPGMASIAVTVFAYLVVPANGSRIEQISLLAAIGFAALIASALASSALRPALMRYVRPDRQPLGGDVP